MPLPVPEQPSRTIETLYRAESGPVLATLVRLLGDLDLAEEAMHEAIAAAMESWPQTGIPDNPRPWLISTPASRLSMPCAAGLASAAYRVDVVDVGPANEAGIMNVSEENHLDDASRPIGSSLTFREFLTI